MTRRKCLSLCALPVTFGAVTVTARSGVHVTGTLTATDQEQQEGYFNLGRELMIVVRPETVPHQQLQAMVNRQVQVSVFTTD